MKLNSKILKLKSTIDKKLGVACEMDENGVARYKSGCPNCGPSKSNHHFIIFWSLNQFYAFCHKCSESWSFQEAKKILAESHSKASKAKTNNGFSSEDKKKLKNPERFLRLLSLKRTLSPQESI